VTLFERLRPWTLVHEPTLPSTNDHAAELLRARTLPRPAVVLTDVQTAGRGQRRRDWVSPGGSLAVTFVIDPHPTRPLPHLPLIAGVLAREAIAAASGLDVRIKWPNDLYLDGRKLGGLLCERIERCDLIGLGVNVADLTLPPGAISLGGRLTRDEVLIAVASTLAGGLLERPVAAFEEVCGRFESFHLLKNRRVRVGETIGRCVGVGKDGELRVMTPTGERAMIRGPIELLEDAEA
jgi:BirA family transcriptional regulator, biotin operon repressor / biotin---[acetyl-CoA-carboxylase] ligase